MAANPLSSAYVTKIKELFATSARLIDSGDFGPWSELFTEDGVQMPPNYPTVTGRAAILDFVRSYPEIRSMSFGEVTVDGCGDLAVGSSAYSLTIAPEGAQEIHDTGKQLVVLRRQGDGRWLVTMAMFNSDLPITA